MTLLAVAYLTVQYMVALGGRASCGCSASWRSPSRSCSPPAMKASVASPPSSSGCSAWRPRRSWRSGSRPAAGAAARHRACDVRTGVGGGPRRRGLAHRGAGAAASTTRRRPWRPTGACRDRLLPRALGDRPRPRRRRGRAHRSHAGWDRGPQEIAADADRGAADLEAFRANLRGRRGRARAPRAARSPARGARRGPRSHRRCSSSTAPTASAPPAPTSCAGATASAPAARCSCTTRGRRSASRWRC